jgi:tetratricopeptide (TPR) repeat protein
LGRWVALKAPHAASIVDADRFLREARTVAGLQHPRIVRVLDAGQDDQGCYMVSELVEGVSLADKIKQTSYGFRDAASLIAQIADGLAYAHRMGIVHRDLKPHNILIDANGDPFITDFGLAKEWQQHAEQMTLEGHIVGTPAFMAPEQARGESIGIEPRTDLYALGVILFQLLTGELPFRGNVDSILHQVITLDPPSPRTLLRKIPEELDILCVKCMEKNPSQRIASAELLRDELQRFLNNKPILSRPLGAWGRMRKLAKRKPGLTLLGLVSASLLLIIAAISLGSAIVVAKGWNREFGLRVDAELAKHNAEQAIESETKSRQLAIDAQAAAEANARRATEEALLSQQSLQFLESVIQATDPVSWILGSQAGGIRDVPKLTELLDAAAVRAKTELANQPRVQTRLMDTIANSYRGLGRYVEAKQLLEQSQLIRNAAGVHKDPAAKFEANRNQFYLGLIHQDLAEYDKAEECYKQAMSNAEGTSVNCELFIADVEFQMGWLKAQQRQDDESKTHFARALEIRERYLPTSSTAIKAAQVGIEIAQAKNLSELPLEQLAATIAGNDRASKIASEYLQMLALRSLKNYDAASVIYGRIVEQLEEILSDQHPLYLLALGEYADLLWKKGDYRQALPQIEKAIAVGEKLAPSHPKLRNARLTLAVELSRAQRFREANEQFKKIIELDSANDTFSAEAHDGLIWTEMLLERPSTALEYAQKLVDRAGDQMLHQQAWYQFSLARIHQQLGNSDASKSADAEARRIANSFNNPPEIAIWLERLAVIHTSEGNLEKAESFNRKAVEIERANHPALHPRITDRMTSLISILRKRNKRDEALALLYEALESREKTLPPDDVRIDATRKTIQQLEAGE